MGIGAVGLAASACTVPGAPAPTSLFSSGIAAGLHSDTEVVLWTRLDPLVATPGSVDWEVAPDPTFTSVVAAGTSAVGPASDYTVKVLVGGLAPDQSYWYRFVAPSAASAVGRARTLPVAGSSVSQLRLAYASCQCYANGYYTAWRQIATQPVDAVLFLGDYIYESALIQLLRTVREEGLTEARTLEDYRAKYRLYKTDPDLQAAHAAHPFVTVWDDHEIVNDYDASVFTTDPGRASAAYQAWFEYQPVWPISGNRIYRDLPWGDLGQLFMLDTRQYRGGSPPRRAAVRRPGADGLRGRGGPHHPGCRPAVLADQRPLRGPGRRHHVEDHRQPGDDRPAAGGRTWTPRRPGPRTRRSPSTPASTPTPTSTPGTGSAGNGTCCCRTWTRPASRTRCS